MRKVAITFTIFACFFLVFYGNVYAMVSGNCSNCHTMHNSQNGTSVAKDDSGNPVATSYIGMTIYSCLGCHSSSNPAEYMSGIGAPIVYNTGGPSYGFYDGTNYHGLAGGNFHWVLTDDEKGHNVFASNPEDTMDLSDGAPGRTTGVCAGSGSCHYNIHETVSGIINPFLAGLNGRQGCTKCHMIQTDPVGGQNTAPLGYHHANDTGPVIDSDAEGWYRFLEGHNSGAGRGVSGMEDTDWQNTYSATDHNEYLGNDISKASVPSGMGGGNPLGNIMTGFCIGCHGLFHWQQNVDGSPWIRHPSDEVIPNSGEYASMTSTYDPQVPVARDDLSGWTNPSGTVTLDQDMVMCLSCHRPHGSPYNDMLRWDYSGMVAGGSGSGGCFVCHTEKN